MLFIYGKNDEKYEVVNSDDGTSRFMTLQELGEMSEEVKGFNGREVNLNWIKAEMSKRLLMFHLFEYEELNLCLSKLTGLITCINPSEKIYWRFMESTEYMFETCFWDADAIDLSSFDTGNVVCMKGMFKGYSGKGLDISCLDTHNVTDMSGMFYNCKSLERINLGNLDTSKVTDMNCMFSGCSSLQAVNTEVMDTSNVENMYGMFSGCKSLGYLNVSSFITSKVTNMECMFSGCINLESLDVKSFDTHNVTDMSSLFSNCIKLKLLDLSNFNTSNVTTMSYMFCNCRSLEILYLSSFDTGSVRDMLAMFFNCDELKNLDLRNFDMKSVEDITYMFGDGVMHYHYIQKYIDALHIMRFIGSGAVVYTDETGMIEGMKLLRKMEKEIGMDFTSFTEKASFNRKVLENVLDEVVYSI